MSEQNEPTLPPDPNSPMGKMLGELTKRGVDAVWNDDARQILFALIRSGAPGAPAVQSAIQAADALAAARQERGGFRSPQDDFRKTLSEILEQLPAITEGFTQFITAMRKLDKDQDHH
jgi:hypothetical protein